MAYTGPFPHNNSGVTTAIIVSDKTFTGSLDNTGTIILGNPTNGSGILVENNSTINGQISNNGTIEVAGNGIIVAGTTSAIDKSNVVSGIVNGAAGIITTASGDGVAVKFESKFSGGITNFGTVSANGFISVGLLALDVSTFAGGIDNTGTVDAAIGILVDNDGHFSGGVNNAGPIDAGAADIGIQDVSVFAGNITNKGALTTTLSQAIVVSSVDFAAGGTFSGTIDNSGVISADLTGIKINKVGFSRFSGGITNSGGITAATGAGVAITDVAEDGSFVGSIVNTGNIQSFGIGLTIAGIGTSSFDSVVVVGHGHHAQTTTGGISNSGAITSANAAGIGIDEIAANGTFSGNIANSGAISAKGNGIQIGTVGSSAFFGGISNSGAITSTSGVGINIQDVASSGAADFTKGIVNSGKIVAKSTGITIANLANSRFSGGITNSGVITSAAGQALKIENVAGDGTFTNNIVNTGALTADETGLHISNVGASEFSGSIANSGAITSTSNVGIDIGGNADDGNFIGNIANSGAVSAKVTGVQIENNGSSNFSGNIVNTGAITSKSNVGITINADAHRTFTGNITNSGAVSAKDAGVQVEDDGGGKFTGNITNSGAITSKSNVGIDITGEAGSGTFTGNIVNTGEVSAKTTGVQIQGDGDSRFSGDIINSGLVSSEDNTGVKIGNIAGDGAFVGSIINTGAVLAKEAALEIGSIGNSGFSGGISNSGAITSTSGDGIDINAVAGSGKFTGTIVNIGAVSAHNQGLNFTGIASASEFSGTIDNSGRITAKSDTGITIQDIGNIFAGTIENSGAVTAHKKGFDIGSVGASSFSGVIGNSGAISASTGAGFSIQDVADGGKFSGTIANSGALSAHGDGFNVNDVGASYFSGTISNSGAIGTTTGVGVMVSQVANDGSFKGNIVNTGPIAANASGMLVEDVGASSFSGNISNSGKISSTTAAGINVQALANDGNFTGNVINAGSVSAFASGIAVMDIAHTFFGGVTNSGVMSIQNAAGIALHHDPKVVGNVVNAATGVITGLSGIAIGDSTIAGSVIDAGTIFATDAGISIDGASKVSAAGTAIDITGATLAGAVINEGVIDGKVGLAVTSASGVNVFNEGTISGSGGTAVEFKAAGDDLTLGEGYVVGGAVVATAGDALQLGGAIAADFNLAAIGTQYKGFTDFNVVGAHWTVSGSGGGWTVDSAGEMILNGAVLSNSNVASGGTAVISANGTFETTTAGAAVIAGDVIDDGTMVASGGVIEFNSATVTLGVGGIIQIDNGIIRVQGDGNEDVNFNDGDSGGLEISDHAGATSAYTGTIGGFGGFLHSDHAEYIDLTSVTFVGGTITGSYNSGTEKLTVSSGGTVVAVIDVGGTYSGGNFHYSSGVGDTVEITDPAVHSGGHHHDHNPGHSANLGLLANYIANFGGEAHGNVLISSVGQIDPVPPLLVGPHR